MTFTAVRESLKKRLPVRDGAFDVVYPSWVRRASQRFWTPVRVALEAADLLERAGAKTVLDVGSGVGKFAVVACLASSLDITGVEQRAHLVSAARNAAERYGAPATFICGRIEHIDPHAYDALYFFNPFAENLVSQDERLDDEVPLNRRRFAQDVQLVECWLEEVPVGTSVVTYNGMGGRIPASYELVHARPAGRPRLRLWTKRHPGRASSFFVESRDTIRALRGLPARRQDPTHE